MDQDIKKLEDKLKRLTVKLEGDATKDAPILVEIERVISWLEMFNTLLKGLIKMNKVVEKSAVCHQKVKMLLEHQRRQQNLLKDYASSHGTVPLAGSKKSSPTTGQDKRPLKHHLDSNENEMKKGEGNLRRTSTFTSGKKPIAQEAKHHEERCRHSSSRSTGSSSSSSSSCYSSASSQERTQGMRTHSSYTRQQIEDSLAARVAAILHRTAVLDEWEDRQKQTKTRRKREETVTTAPIKSKSCQDFPSQPTKSMKKQHNIPSKRAVSKCFSADQMDATVESRNSVHHPRNGDVWFVPLSSGDVNMSLQEAFQRNRLGIKERIKKRREDLQFKVQRRKELLDLLFKTKKHPYMFPPVDEDDLRRKRHQSKDLKVNMRRVFTHKEMRNQTERIYTKLPEVKEKEHEKRIAGLQEDTSNHEDCLHEESEAANFKRKS